MNAATTTDTKLSDALVYREVVNYLSGPGCPKLKGIVIEVVDGVVTLRGPVPSYYTRQLLVHGCQRVPRIARVVDELYVVSGTALRRSRLAE
jgi:hypothetical protein